MEVFEFVWATTWGASANDVYGLLHDLPPLPFIQLGEMPRTGTRKLAAVHSYVGSRPLAWVDDELYDDADTWARERSAPTFLLRTRASVGLTHADVERLIAFAQKTTD